MSEENTPEVPATFLEDLRKVINYHSVDAQLNTPDYILASFVNNVLTDLNFVNQARQRWAMG